MISTRQLAIISIVVALFVFIISIIFTIITFSTINEKIDFELDRSRDFYLGLFNELHPRILKLENPQYEPINFSIVQTFNSTLRELKEDEFLCCYFGSNGIRSKICDIGELEIDYDGNFGDYCKTKNGNVIVEKW